MKYYELTYLIDPDLSETEIKSLTEKVANHLQKEGGIIHNIDNAHKTVKKVLGYPIKKKFIAYLVSLDFSIDPQKTDGLKQNISLEKSILRFLLISKKLIKEERKDTKPGTKKALPTSPPDDVKKKSVDDKKVELEELDQKLDEILN